MPSQVYSNYAMGPPQVICLVQSWSPTDFLTLVSIMVFVFCFQFPVWLLCSPMRALPLEFAPLQPYGVHQWQAYVPPDAGSWLTPGVHW